MLPVLNVIEEERIKLYSPDGVYIGDCNLNEMLDFRIQCAELKIAGYYLIHSDGTRSIINEYGEVDRFNDNTFHLAVQLARKLRLMGLFTSHQVID
jgi:hypothetical protein